MSLPPLSLASGSSGNFPWVSGLKPGHAFDRSSRAIADILLEKIELFGKSEKTAQAEAGLGLHPSWYWFVARTDDTYGFAVFFWTSTDELWYADERGICPFDSGGLWHGHVLLTPPLLTAAEKQAFFELHDRPLLGWNERFVEYLATNYDTFADYVNGLAPKSGIHEIRKDANGPLAWSWEARLQRTDVPGRVVVSRLFCRGEFDKRFLNWLEDDDTIDFSTEQTVRERFLRVRSVCSDALTPSAAAKADLVK